MSRKETPWRDEDHDESWVDSMKIIIDMEGGVAKLGSN
jgi:hypothetical protein